MKNFVTFFFFGLILNLHIDNTATAQSVQPQEATDKKIIELKKQLAELIYSQKKTTNVTSKRQYQEIIDEKKHEFIEYYEGNTFCFAPLSVSNLRVDDVGDLGSFKVINVMSDREMLVKKTDTLLLLEQPTAGFVEDQTRDEGVYCCIGTRSKTLTGKTISQLDNERKKFFVCKPYGQDSEANLPAIKATHELPWYDRNGEHVGTGEFIEIKGTKVKFLRDGQKGEVPISFFNWGDRGVMEIISQLDKES